MYRKAQHRRLLSLLCVVPRRRENILQGNYLRLFARLNLQVGNMFTRWQVQTPQRATWTLLDWNFSVYWSRLEFSVYFRRSADRFVLANRGLICWEMNNRHLRRRACLTGYGAALVPLNKEYRFSLMSNQISISRSNDCRSHFPVTIRPNRNF